MERLLRMRNQRHAIRKLVVAVTKNAPRFKFRTVGGGEESERIFTPLVSFVVGAFCCKNRRESDTKVRLEKGVPRENTPVLIGDDP